MIADTLISRLELQVIKCQFSSDYRVITDRRPKPMVVSSIRVIKSVIKISARIRVTKGVTPAVRISSYSLTPVNRTSAKSYIIVSRQFTNKRK